MIRSSSEDHIMRRKLILIVLLTAALLPAAAQSQLPETPAGKQFSGWLAAFNSGDRETMLKFLQGNFLQRVAQIDQLMRFQGRVGGFDFKKVEESTPTRLTGIVKEHKSDNFARFEVTVEPAEPHRITSLNLRRLEEMPPPRTSEAEALAALRAKLAKESAADRFAGAVLVAHDGKPVFQEAYGLADREKKLPNSLSTRFRIGSMNKMFTAVATLQLVEAGKIKLTDPLGKYLTDYPNKDVASKVTIHHLLTHTGGTGDIFGPQFDAHRLELKTLQDYVKLYGQRGLEFEPGSRWAYSNYGFLLLGVLIEKVTGQSYYDYVQEHVYKPAGMTATGSLPENETVSGRSTGYTKEPGDDSWHPNTDTLPYRGTSAGGGYSTVEDLLRFANALQQHKLLNAQNTELLTTAKDNPGGARYAYGFFDEVEGGVRCFGHGGGAPGMNGELKICPAAGYVIAVLANMDPPAATRISDFVASRLPEK
jgi:CubicO group peptidase (beta-lactamase class C family)